MMRFLRVFLVASLLISSPAFARERASEIDVPAVSIDQAVRILGGQSGVNIGYRDQDFARIRVRPVRGKLTVGEALKRMLRGTGVRARRIAENTYLIEATRIAARPAKPAPQKVRTTPAPPPAPPPPPREIVVTASKRDIPIEDYPGSVQILDGDRLSIAEGGRGSDALEARLASVVSTHLGPGRNKLFIRGIADSSFIGPTQATVGQYWGNSRITYSAPDPRLRLYDVSRVEVLEGPQGTLYGAGSLGGVVRVLPRAPDATTVAGSAWGGVQAVQHGDPGLDAGAVINLPLQEDRLALRVVGFGAHEGGYVDDTQRGLNDVNRVRTFGGRAALRFTPGNDWTLDLNVLGQTIDGKDSQYTERGQGLSRSSSIAQPFSNDFWLADLVVSKKWDNLELTTSLGYAGQKVFEQFDGAGFTDSGLLSVRLAQGAPALDAGFAAIEGLDLATGLPVTTAPDGTTDSANASGSGAGGPVALSAAGVTQSNDIEMYTAEMRLARRGPNGTGWLVGLSLLHNEASVVRDLNELQFGRTLTGARNRAREATLYGEASIALLDRLTATLGGRLTHSQLSGSAQGTVPETAFRADPQAAATRTQTSLLPSLSLAYRVAGHTTLYARYQESFRPGGLAVRRDFIQSFDGDQVRTFEAGGRYRSAAFDFEANASLTDWNNIQADLIDGYGFPTTANVGDGRVFSVGAATRWRPLSGLELDASIYINHSRVTSRTTLPADGSSTDYSVEASTALAQFTRLPNIADVSARVGFAFATPLTDSLDFRVDGFGRYLGQSTLGIGPILGQLQGDYFDTGLELRVSGQGYGLSLALTNLLDSRGNRFALGSPFLIRDRNQITPLQPRTMRLGFEVTF